MCECVSVCVSVCLCVCKCMSVHVTALGVLCCFALLTLLASPSHLSLKTRYVHVCMRMYVVKISHNNITVL